MNDSTSEERREKLINAWNEFVKCIIYDTFIIKIIDKLGLQVKERYRRKFKENKLEQ